MKVEIIDHISGNQEIETKGSGILVYDKDGNEYHIKEGQWGGLEVYSTNDKLSIEPCYSNLIYLKTRK